MTPDTTTAPAHTGSRFTRWLGAIVAVGMVLVGAYAFVFTPADTEMGDSVRLMYIHLAVIAVAYLAFITTAIGSIAYLWKRSTWWDVVAESAAEIGVVFGALMLITGAIWGRPTWGTYWRWDDVRLISTLILELLFVGYVALRKVPGDREVVAKRAAVVALVGVSLIPLVSRSVTWWADRTLHQTQTITTLDPKLDDEMLFAAYLSIVVFVGFGLWLLVHRFRVAWLERQAEVTGLDAAIAERLGDASDQTQVDDAVRVGAAAGESGT